MDLQCYGNTGAGAEAFKPSLQLVGDKLLQLDIQRCAQHRQLRR